MFARVAYSTARDDVETYAQRYDEATHKYCAYNRGRMPFLVIEISFFF